MGDEELGIGMHHEDEQSEMERLVEWSRHLSWPQDILQLYADDDENAMDNHFDLMQRVCMAQQRINKSNTESIGSLNQRINAMNEQMNNLQLCLERQRDEHLRDKERFAVSTANELNRLREAIKNVGLRQQQLDSQSQRKRINPS